MNSKIDLKSALCGLLVGVVGMLAIGATDGAGNPVGRYQCSAAIDLLMIVDTMTGQAWAMRPAGTSITAAPSGFWDKKADK